MKKTLLQFFRYNLVNGFFLLLLICVNSNLFAQTPDSVLFEEDFNRNNLGDFWKADNSWSIKDGSAYNFIDGTGGTLKTATNYAIDSYIIETTAHGFTDNYMREYRITFGQANIFKDSMYVLSYKPYNGGIITLSRAAENIYYPVTLDEAVIYPHLNTIDSYKFKIAKYKSGLIQVYVDKGTGYGNTPFLEVIDKTYAKAGNIGWQIDTQSFAESFYVDNIKAVKPGLEKPAVKEKPAEDNLITQVSAKSENLYTVTKLNKGRKLYSDRNYTITSVPAYLKGASFVQTANNDKKDVSDTFLTFFVKKSAIVYIGYDPRATKIPTWLKDWTKTGDSIGTNDRDISFLQVYSKLLELGSVYPYPFILGGNLAGNAVGAQSNYVVAAVERPEIKNLQAEDARLSGAIKANNHTGYSGIGFANFVNASHDYIEWTVKIDIPGSYSLGFKYANGGIADRLVEITNNATSVEKISFSSTSSWSSWSFYSGTNVYLTSGIHKIRATAIGTSGPNIDELSLYYQSSLNINPTAQKVIPNNNLISNFFETSLKAYPNPFTQNTKIAYSVKEKTKVVLGLYSLEGQHLQTLVNSVKLPGNYQVDFDGSKLPAGTYLYHLQTGSEVKSGKLLKQ